jgi:hypothetical protein
MTRLLAVAFYGLVIGDYTKWVFVDYREAATQPYGAVRGAPDPRGPEENC